MLLPHQSKVTISHLARRQPPLRQRLRRTAVHLKVLHRHKRCLVRHLKPLLPMLPSPRQRILQHSQLPIAVTKQQVIRLAATMLLLRMLGNQLPLLITALQPSQPISLPLHLAVHKNLRLLHKTQQVSQLILLLPPRIAHPHLHHLKTVVVKRLKHLLLNNRQLNHRRIRQPHLTMLAKHRSHLQRLRKVLLLRIHQVSRLKPQLIHRQTQQQAISPQMPLQSRQADHRQTRPTAALRRPHKHGDEPSRLMLSLYKKSDYVGLPIACEELQCKRGWQVLHLPLRLPTSVLLPPLARRFSLRPLYHAPGSRHKPSHQISTRLPLQLSSRLN